MKRNEIHFIREILIENDEGCKVAVLQVSYDDISIVNPNFEVVPPALLIQVRALYASLGGGSFARSRGGTTVMVPRHRYRERFGDIPLDAPPAVESPDSVTASLRSELPTHEDRRARKRLMGD